jgi:hypothetical protein
MKKTMLLFAAGLCFAGAAISQDVYENKNGVAILPAAGDWAIGFDAVPMLNMALNVVNIMDDSGQDAGGVMDYQSGFTQTLVGKYYVSATQAYRVRFHMNNSTTSTTTFGDDPLDTSGDPANIQLQKSKTGTSSYLVGAGMEMRRGKNRLHGFYGGEALLGFDSEKTKTSYDISYNTAAADAGYMSIGSSRVLSDKSGMAITFGARGFIGVEYFVLPKISLGAEYGFGLYMTTDPRGKTEAEVWEDPDGNGEGSANTEESEGDSKETNMGLAVDNGNTNTLSGGNASLSAIFHF